MLVESGSPPSPVPRPYPDLPTLWPFYPTYFQNVPAPLSTGTRSRQRSSPTLGTLCHQIAALAPPEKVESCTPMAFTVVTGTSKAPSSVWTMTQKGGRRVMAASDFHLAEPLGRRR